MKVDHDTLFCRSNPVDACIPLESIRRICPPWQIFRPNLRGGMRLSARGLLATPWFGAILSLLTLGTVLPSTARAGCSDHYVTSRSRSAGELAHLELLGRSGAIPSPWDESSHERPTPCSGALCSGNPAPPPSTVPSVLPAGAGQWAIPAFPIAVPSTKTSPKRSAYHRQVGLSRRRRAAAFDRLVLSSALSPAPLPTPSQRPPDAPRPGAPAKFTPEQLTLSSPSPARLPRSPAAPSPTGLLPN